MPAFNPQPTLAGNLITLRPLRQEDFAALYEVARDPMIWEQHPARDRYQEPVFRAFFEASMQSGGALLIQDAANGATLGSSRYFGWDAVRSEVEIGWTFLARSCWGGRHNTQLKALMLTHALASFDSVIFRVGVQNLRSQHAVLKLGAQLEGEAVVANGLASFTYRLAKSAYAPAG